ncbi:hypothetical protein Hanom_Chr06g00522261 [Helianthus anomalus]
MSDHFLSPLFIPLSLKFLSQTFNIMCHLSQKNEIPLSLSLNIICVISSIYYNNIIFLHLKITKMVTVFIKVYNISLSSNEVQQIFIPHTGDPQPPHSLRRTPRFSGDPQICNPICHLLQTIRSATPSVTLFKSLILRGLMLHLGFV